MTAAGQQGLAQQLRGGRYRMCRRREVHPGERVGIVGSWSEASMHLGLTGRLLEVELTTAGHRELYMAQVYEPGAPEPFTSGLTPGEAGVYQKSSSGEMWTYEPVAPLVVAGWQQPPPAGKTQELETDQWEEASGWLAGCAADHARDARYWADYATDGCTRRPPCPDCQVGVGCWRQAAGDLTSLAETLRKPPPEPGWSQTAAGSRYWLQQAVGGQP